MKVCTSCLRRRRLSSFRRYWGRSSDGRRPVCVDCQRQYEAQWRARNKERLGRARAVRAAKERDYRRGYDAENRGRLLVTEAARRSKRKGLPCDLLSFLPELEERVQRGRCEMTGLPFDFHNKIPNWNSPSLHRVNPSLGYVYPNIRVICFAMNAALGSWGEDRLAQLVEAWLRRDA